MVAVALLMGPAAVVAVTVVYVGALRTRHHYTSMLTCPRCGRTFAYQWVPMASFSAFRLGTSRYLECPLCREWSTFDMRKTRVESGSTAAPKA